jgi:hypothetical protein
VDEQQGLSGGGWDWSLMASGGAHEKFERRAGKRIKGALLLNKVLVEVEE